MSIKKIPLGKKLLHQWEVYKKIKLFIYRQITQLGPVKKINDTLNGALTGALGGFIKTVNTFIDTPEGYNIIVAIDYSRVPVNSQILNVLIMGYAGFISNSNIDYVCIGIGDTPQSLTLPKNFKVQSSISQHVRISYKIVYI